MKKLLGIILIVCILMCSCNKNENTIQTETQENSVVTGEINESESKNIDNGDTEEDLPIITLRLLIPASAVPNMQELNKIDDEMNQSANNYLREIEKEYRVCYQTVQMQNDIPSVEELEGADIICSINSPDVASEYYQDISTELFSGKLNALYESLPELYWERVNVRGAIYSWLATPPEVQTLYINNYSLLETKNTTVPTDLSGKSVEYWTDYFESIYEMMGEEPFIHSVAVSSAECPIAASNGWNGKFQLVLPFIGIDTENPELGVQCIYESSYGKGIQNVWCSLYEKGYMTSDVFQALWSIAPGYDTAEVMMNNDMNSFPLQSVSYASPQIVGVNYYSSGISKSCQQQELVYEFIDDMMNDINLHEAMIRNSNGDVWFHIIPQTLFVENNGQGFYLGTREENINKMEERFSSANPSPVPGFIMDIEPVETEVDAIMQFLSSQNFFTQLNALISDGKVPEYAMDIHYVPDEIIDILYDIGLQKVIDEANRQLDEYLNK